MFGSTYKIYSKFTYLTGEILCTLSKYYHIANLSLSPLEPWLYKVLGSSNVKLQWFLWAVHLLSLHGALWVEEVGDVFWRQDIFAFESVTYSHFHNVKRRSWHTTEITKKSSEEKEYQMLNNAQTCAERQMEVKCNSWVDEITIKSYNEKLQATNTAEWFSATKLSSLESYYNCNGMGNSV